MGARTGQLDTTIEIITPENIAFQYRVAGPFRRLLAWLIDFVIRFFFVVAVGIAAILVGAFLQVSGLAIGVTFAIVFIVQWLYGGLFEAFWNGQTLGKRLVGIRVMSKDGQPISGFQAVLRNVLRAADMQPFMLYMAGLFTATMTRRFQRLGDLAARTIVVIDETHGLRGVAPIADPEAIRLAGLIPAGFQASPTLGRALAAYVQRRGQFAWGRRFEIAAHLGEPMRDRFQLPPNTNLDMLLCALYYRAFIADRNDARVMSAGSPFQQHAGQPAAHRQARAASCPVAPEQARAASCPEVAPAGSRGDRREERIP
jgi:uncharacterized RDD family membrane protein YckC